MADQTDLQAAHPGFYNRDREMIPRILLMAMLVLALASLALVTLAVVTDRPLVGQPKPAATVQHLDLVLQSTGGTSVLVTSPDGTVLADLANGGFISAVQRGLARERLVHGITGNPAVELKALENGRLTLSDPQTGWSVELGHFGKDNKAAFERLLSN